MTTPWEVQRQGFRWLPVVITALIVAIAIWMGLSIATSRFLWWQQGQAISRNYANVVHSQEYQESLVAEMNQHLGNIEGNGGISVTRSGLPAGSGMQVTLKAQELSELREFCQEAQNLTPQDPAGSAKIPGAPTLDQIIAANCIRGAVAANPPLAMNPIPDGGA